jgi:hypothetical protein
LDAALRGVPSCVYLSSLHRSEKMFDYYGYQEFGLCSMATDLDGLVRTVEQAASRNENPARISAFEAGVVQDPIEEKRAALSALVTGMSRERGVECELNKRYVAIPHRDSHLFVSGAYARIIDDEGWLLMRGNA